MKDKNFAQNIITGKRKAFYFLLLTSCFLLVLSCGYRIIGSTLLPFDSITIKPVKNDTYEPKLEERMHTALSSEFINQGISVKASGGDVVLETTVTAFALGSIASVDEDVKEQEIIMQVDLRLTSGGKTTEFRNMTSPIKITFQSTGTVGESVAQKEKATDKACREISKEIVSKIIIKYAE